jgi:hypothetical protein
MRVNTLLAMDMLFTKTANKSLIDTGLLMSSHMSLMRRQSGLRRV